METSSAQPLYRYLHLHASVDDVHPHGAGPIRNPRVEVSNGRQRYHIHSGTTCLKLRFTGDDGCFIVGYGPRSDIVVPRHFDVEACHCAIFSQTPDEFRVKDLYTAKGTSAEYSYGAAKSGSSWALRGLQSVTSLGSTFSIAPSLRFEVQNICVDFATSKWLDHRPSLPGFAKTLLNTAPENHHGDPTLFRLGPLGHGGFCEVDRFWWSRANKVIAVKKSRADRTALRESIIKEALMLQTLRHVGTKPRARI